jgi:hypothetical protein
LNATYLKVVASDIVRIKTRKTAFWEVARLIGRTSRIDFGGYTRLDGASSNELASFGPSHYTRSRGLTVCDPSSGVGCDRYSPAK